MNLTTSRTQQFCETSSIFQVDNIKNEAILRDLLQKRKVECRAAGLVPMPFAIFPLHLSKVLRLPRKSDARSYEVLHLSRKIILANLKIWCSKMQPALSGNRCPDLLLLYCACHVTRCAIPCACHAKRHLNLQSGPRSSVISSLDFEMRSAPQRPALFRPTLRWFVHFDLEMCFVPQQCASVHVSSGQIAPHPTL